MQSEEMEVQTQSQIQRKWALLLEKRKRKGTQQDESTKKRGQKKLKNLRNLDVVNDANGSIQSSHL